MYVSVCECMGALLIQVTGLVFLFVIKIKVRTFRQEAVQFVSQPVSLSLSHHHGPQSAGGAVQRVPGLVS